MDFFLRLKPNQVNSISQRYLTALGNEIFDTGILYIEKLLHLDYQFKHGTDMSWVFGDVIKYNPYNELDNKGFFYTILCNPEQGFLNFAPDFHSFLPIYYARVEDEIVVSSSIELIIKQLKQITFNQSFLADMALFNVPVGEKCFFNEIKRLPYGKTLEVNSQGLALRDRRRVYDLITTKPTGYLKSLPSMSEIFIENCREYYDRPASVALTGGFDSRTLCAMAHYYKNDFQCFTHGKAADPDVAIPVSIGRQLSLKHRLIDLSGSYISKQYYKYVRESLVYSGGMNGFLYPHFIYDAAILAEDSETVINGFCGSELMRNAHFGGAISSQAVIDLLASGYEYALSRVESDLNYKNLSADFDRNTQLPQSLSEAEGYLNSLPEDLDKNQKLAVYEFEEVLPKLFGNWIYAGMHYVRSRAPFMDIRFYTEIIGTQISQVYRRFLEQNPIKRFWGQYFYATVINKTWPELGKLPSGKGYAPHDLLSYTGKIRTAQGYLGKRKRKLRVTYDNLGLLSGLEEYIRVNNAGLPAELRNTSILEKLAYNEKLRDLTLLNYSVYEYKRIHTS